MQKSCTGLLRSLLYQIATQWLELVNLARMQHGSGKRGVDVSRNFLPAWTDERLLSILTRFLDQKPTSVNLCAFVDGLDEFVGDEEVLLNVVRLSTNNPQCKICVSSRPEQAYRQEFKSCPQLRVQDLNREDLERTVIGKLIPGVKRHMRMESGKLDCLRATLFERAQGVFLWLDLIIKDLITGARNYDSIDMLQSRLERAPETIQGMYTQMLGSVQPIYQDEGVRYFSILLAAAESDLGLGLQRLACTEDEPWQKVVKLDLKYCDTSRFVSICRRLKTRLTASCGGLIDVQNELGNEEVKAELKVMDDHQKVDFIHRTAMEFVRGKLEDLQDLDLVVKANTFLAQGSIVELTLIPPPSNVENGDPV